MKNVKKLLPKIVLGLLLVLCGFSVYAKDRTITGKVTDSKSEPLIGVVILATGTTIGAMTDANGNYAITVPEGQATLQFSYVGYNTESEIIGVRSVIDVMLIDDITKLEEIVVVGYGTMKKRDLTGSVGSLKSEQIVAIPVTNVTEALQGKIAGVNVVSQDGRPDATVSIRIRGGSSISQSNDPLYIVDGFPVSNINDIPSSQIESVDVLKDASSTAIYGSRGSNGVIMITTKSGKNGKLKVLYTGYAKINLPIKYEKTMNAYDYIAYNWAYAAAISDTYASAWEKLWGIGRFAETYNNSEGIDHYKKVGARNFSKEAYGKSLTQSHSLSLSGGNENTKILFGLDRIQDDGMKLNSWYNRTNATFKLDQKLSNCLTFTLDTRFANVDKVGDESTTNGTGSILSSAFTFRPIATIDVLGELDDSQNSSLGLFDKVLQDQFNPVSRIKDYTVETKSNSFTANSGLSWKPIKGLTVRSEVSFSGKWNKKTTWSGAIFNNYLNAAGEKTFSGDAAIETSDDWNSRWSNTLTYDIQGLGKKHSLVVLAGQEISNSGGSKVNVSGKEYPVSFDSERAFAMMDQHDIISATSYNFTSNVSTPNRMLSYFGRVNYSFLDRYLLTGTFRADGSSKFSPIHSWGYFPAGAIAWRMSDESFMKDNARWIGNLKFRFSYGQTGNCNIDATKWKQVWSPPSTINAWSINEVQQNSYNPGTTIANPDLKWETTTTRNLGLDFGILNNRIYGSFEVYRNTTNNLLWQVTIPAITGFATTFKNIGSTTNKGIDISLGADIVRSKDFNLSANFNINFNRGNIDEMAGDQVTNYSSTWGGKAMAPTTGDYSLQIGQPVGVVRGYKYDGWYTTNDFTFTGGQYTLKPGVADIGTGILGTVQGTTGLKPGSQSAYPGVMKLKDINGDGIINESDVVNIGNMNPKHTGGFNIQGNFQNLDFALAFNWSYGNQLYNAAYLSAFVGGKEDGLYKNRLNYLTSSYKNFDIQNGNLVKISDPAALDALNVNATGFLPYQENPVISSLGIQDGTYLRLNTVTFGYTLPSKLLNAIKITKIRVFSTVNNVFTWTNYKGLDPEVSINSTASGTNYPLPGMDWGAYPRARSFTFGLNVEF